MEDDGMNPVKVCVLRIEGTNCEQETYDAFLELGAHPEMVHLKKLTPETLFSYQCLMIPGGFSSGDYVRAGAIFAARMKSRLFSALKKYVEHGYPVGGICNGFQILVELGFLPRLSDHPEACLATNDSARFECRPTLLKLENHCAFTQKMDISSIYEIPSAHAEGKFVSPHTEELMENGQIIFRYVDPQGQYAGYPWNPNGSQYNIAGICNEQGNVFGMMPHPERAFHRVQNQEWTRHSNRTGGHGRMVFESVIEYARRL
ncbi:MAG: phosphoribosylformylglycinamidine synthase subunit PurQ [Theionarchaea archaeon]|nr:phosphoribosylformylglycinamidine synthase subunit PurQ [Theionarchaea archaeon]